MLAAKSRSSSTCRALPDAQVSYRKGRIGLEGIGRCDLRTEKNGQHPKVLHELRQA
jgi:hypothetical protein